MAEKGKQNNTPKYKQKLHKVIRFEVAVLAMLLAAVVFVGGVFVWDGAKEDVSNLSLTQEEFEGLKEKLKESSRASDAPTVTDASEWETYTNSNLGISFQYPPSWTLKRMEDEGRGVIEIVAQRDQSTMFTYHSGEYNEVGFAEESTVIVDGRSLTQKKREFDIRIPVSDTQLIKFESDKLDTYDEVLRKILSTVNFL